MNEHLFQIAIAFPNNQKFITYTSLWTFIASVFSEA